MAQILPNTTGRAGRLNRMAPAAAVARLGDLQAELIAASNAQNAAIRALVTKLNSDAGVTDTNYSAAGLIDIKSLDAR